MMVRCSGVEKKVQTRASFTRDSCLLVLEHSSVVINFEAVEI